MSRAAAHRHRLRLPPLPASRAAGCVLGGVEIPGEPGLAGHSDADVVSHALADALLGAAGLGDIGDHFPDDDPRWADADSIELLGRVAAMLADEGWRAANADVTVIAERPRLGPLKAADGGAAGGRARRRAGACEREGDDERGHGLHRAR